MQSRTRQSIPPLLTPYVGLPGHQGSLILLTQVLGASNNWLVLRYILACLRGDMTGKRGGDDDGGGQGDEGRGTNDFSPVVVLVSWMHDFEFWKTEARRAFSLDLARLANEGRFIFVDGLKEILTSSKDNKSTTISSATVPNASTNRGRPSTPISTPRTAQSPRPNISSAQQNANSPLSEVPSQTSPAAPQDQPQKPTPTPTYYYLQDPSASTFKTTVSNIASHLSTDESSEKPRKMILILDNPTIATSLSLSLPESTSNDYLNSLLELRFNPQIHTCIVSLPADDALVKKAAAMNALGAESGANMVRYMKNSNRQGIATGLETSSAAFTIHCAMQASMVLGCRRLGTGWAGDVSGVLRRTRGGSWEDFRDESENIGADDQRKGTEAEGIERSGEGEWLYHIGGDGSARVWRRGDDR